MQRFLALDLPHRFCWACVHSSIVKWSDSISEQNCQELAYPHVSSDESIKNLNPRHSLLSQVVKALSISITVFDTKKIADIDLFINRVYLYDDKLVITFNHKEGAEIITLEDVETALSDADKGSDLVSFAVLEKPFSARRTAFLYLSKCCGDVKEWGKERFH